MRLFFWHFFHDIEVQLSYERWIDKYKLLLETLEAGWIPYEEDYASLRQFFKFLYLQDEQHEARFDELFTKAIAREGDELRAILVAKSSTDKTEKKKQTSSPKEDKETPTTPPDPDLKNEIPATENDEFESLKDPETITKYFHLNIEETLNEENNFTTSKTTEKYLYNDDYFPISRREMVKSWQYLRRKETLGQGKYIDVKATVKKIAAEGLFTEVVYQKGQVNRADTLMIFADMRGSMTPFHELTRRLIETAKKEGGHSKAPVYYFHDYPLGQVYERANLTRPIATTTALQKGNRNFTTAFIISDAGAARGHLSQHRAKLQYQNILPFLQQLQRHAAQIVWINPLPQHRWAGTAAELVESKVQLMLPVMEESDFDFQNTIRLMKIGATR